MVRGKNFLINQKNFNKEKTSYHSSNIAQEKLTEKLGEKIGTKDLIRVVQGICDKNLRPYPLCSTPAAFVSFEIKLFF